MTDSTSSRQRNKRKTRIDWGAQKNNNQPTNNPTHPACSWIAGKQKKRMN